LISVGARRQGCVIYDTYFGRMTPPASALKKVAIIIGASQGIGAQRAVRRMLLECSPAAPLAALITLLIAVALGRG
jgi:hypothetical protein